MEKRNRKMRGLLSLSLGGLAADEFASLLQVLDEVRGVVVWRGPEEIPALFHFVA